MVHAPLFKRIASPLLKRLQSIMASGLTPRKLALTFCLGTAFGIIPLVWGTSVICFILAHVFRLNHVALQSVNLLLCPVHLALLVPFFKLGSWLFPWGPPVSPHTFPMLIQNPGTSLYLLGWITLKSVAAWLVTVIPALLLTCGILIAAASGKKDPGPGHEA